MKYIWSPLNRIITSEKFGYLLFAGLTRVKLSEHWMPVAV